MRSIQDTLGSIFGDELGGVFGSNLRLNCAITYKVRERISSPRMPKPRFPCSGVRLIRLNGSAEICSTALLWTTAMQASTLQADAMIRWLKVLNGPA